MNQYFEPRPLADALTKIYGRLMVWPCFNLEVYWRAGGPLLSLRLKGA